MARSLVDYIDSISQQLNRLSILVSTWHDLMSFANKFWLEANYISCGELPLFGTW